MNTMKIMKRAGIILALIALLLIAGCTDSGNSNANRSPGNESAVEKVELYHFHAAAQCYSCVVLGELANQTVRTYYKQKLDSGKLVFAHINIDDEKNAGIVERYGAAGSSLMMGVYGNDGSFYPENLVGAWYRINDPQSYADYLREILDPLLGGSS